MIGSPSHRTIRYSAAKKWSANLVRSSWCLQIFKGVLSSKPLSQGVQSRVYTSSHWQAASALRNGGPYIAQAAGLLIQAACQPTQPFQRDALHAEIQHGGTHTVCDQF